jgi:hypothetical protein
MYRQGCETRAHCVASTVNVRSTVCERRVKPGEHYRAPSTSQTPTTMQLGTVQTTAPVSTRCRKKCASADWPRQGHRPSTNRRVAAAGGARISGPGACSSAGSAREHRFAGGKYLLHKIGRPSHAACALDSAAQAHGVFAITGIVQYPDHGFA